jgi:hypothetical protein
MQVWLVAGAWLFAVLFALVVLGFAGYELAWKARRLNADRAKLNRTMTELTELTGQLQALGDRAAGLRPGAGQATEASDARSAGVPGSRSAEALDARSAGVPGSGSAEGLGSRSAEGLGSRSAEAPDARSARGPGVPSTPPERTAAPSVSPERTVASSATSERAT